VDLGGERKAVNTGSRIHDITENRQERSSLRACNTHVTRDNPTNVITDG